MAPAFGRMTPEIYIYSHTGRVFLTAEAAEGQVPIDTLHGAVGAGVKSTVKGTASALGKTAAKKMVRPRAYSATLIDMEQRNDAVVGKFVLRAGETRLIELKDHHNWKLKLELYHLFPVKGRIVVELQDPEMHKRTVTW